MVTPVWCDPDMTDIRARNVALAAIAGRQHSVFTDRQAWLAGVSDTTRRRLVRQGEWHELYPGVFSDTLALPTFRQRAMGATLWAGDDAATSHGTAALLHALEGAIEEADVHLLTPFARRLATPGVVVHRSRRIESFDLATVDGIPVTTPLRTVLDLAGSRPIKTVELMIEDALRRELFSVELLEWRVDRRMGRGVPGSAALRRLVERRGLGGSGSGWEVRLSDLLESFGLPRPERQVAVRTAIGLLHADLGYPHGPVVVFEYDSDRWHSGVERRHRDLRRRNAMRANGVIVIEVTAALMRNRREFARMVVPLVRTALA